MLKRAALFKVLLGEPINHETSIHDRSAIPLLSTKTPVESYWVQSRITLNCRPSDVQRRCVDIKSTEETSFLPVQKSVYIVATTMVFIVFIFYRQEPF